MNGVLEWACPICRKEIRSLYLTQFQNNIKNHLAKHNLKPKEVEDILKAAVAEAVAK